MNDCRRCYVAHLLAALLAASMFPGCARSGAAESLWGTGGIALEMLVRGEGHLAALYRVQPDGTIGFGGGTDARNRRVTWTGQMTAQEIEQLRSLLQQHGWFHAVPSSTSSAADAKRSYRIKLSWPQGRWRRHITGISPHITPLHDLLEQIARRRLEEDDAIKALPQPGPQSR
ncbi:MAG: hypothetical protein IH830_13935 [Planctomycetes bacterium]|nr:hypothetical protein [Planctomycetota bacterium]